MTVLPDYSLKSNRLRNAWFLGERCFHNNQYLSFILFWFSTIKHYFFFVVLNSSLSSRTYLFSSLEKQSPKSNDNRNVHQLGRAILKCVTSAISLYVNLHEMSLVPNTSLHLSNINLGSKY